VARSGSRSRNHICRAARRTEESAGWTTACHPRSEQLNADPFGRSAPAFGAPLHGDNPWSFTEKRLRRPCSKSYRDRKCDDATGWLVSPPRSNHVLPSSRPGAAGYHTFPTILLREPRRGGSASWRLLGAVAVVARHWCCNHLAMIPSNPSWAALAVERDGDQPDHQWPSCRWDLVLVHAASQTRDPYSDASNVGLVAHGVDRRCGRTPCCTGIPCLPRN
jgi:hypothetical protein